MKKFLLNSFIALISISATIMILEFALRLTNFTALVPLMAYPKNYYVYDQKMGYDISKNFPKENYSMLESKYEIWSNSLGCFDEEFATSTDNYLLLVGDSFTWGYAPFEKKWGTGLENILKTRVLKCGVTGFGTAQELIKTKNTLQGLKNPKMIIVGYYSNDPGDDFELPRRTVYEGYLVGNLQKDGVTAEQAQKTYSNLYNYCVTDVPKNIIPQKVKCWLTNHSVLYQLVKPSLKNLLSKVLGEEILDNAGLVNIPNDAKPSVSISDKELYEKHYKNILAFQSFANSKNADLLFVLIPTLSDLSATSTKNTSLYKTEKFMNSNGINYINLTEPFKNYSFGRPEKFYWKKDSHWNIEGNKLASILVAQYVAKNRLVEVDSFTDLINNLEKQLDNY